MLSASLVIPPLCQECEKTGGASDPGSVVMHKGRVDSILLDTSSKCAKSCDVLVNVGASIRPYYMGEIISEALKAGAEVIYVDPQASTSKNVFLALDYGLNAAERIRCIRSPADEVLKALAIFLVDRLGEEVTKSDIEAWARGWSRKN